MGRRCRGRYALEPCQRRPTVIGNPGGGALRKAMDELPASAVILNFRKKAKLLRPGFDASDRGQGVAAQGVIAKSRTIGDLRAQCSLLEYPQTHAKILTPMYAPRAVVFDLDGTLVDTRADIAEACNHALIESGRSPLTADLITRYVGDGARRLCSRAAGLKDDDDDLDPIVDSFVSYCLEHPVVHTTWILDAEQTLDELKGLQLAVCTNKPRLVAARVLEALGCTHRFAALIGGGDTPAGKPSAEPLLLVAQRLGVDPREMVMVGDGPQDVMAGRAVAARTIAFAGGYTDRHLLREVDPDIIVSSLLEVPAIVDRWQQCTVRSRTVTL
jgi:phosphoglycolate phosphatase